MYAGRADKQIERLLAELRVALRHSKEANVDPGPVQRAIAGVAIARDELTGKKEGGVILAAQYLKHLITEEEPSRESRPIAETPKGVPPSIRVGGDGLGNMGSEVFIGAALTYRRSDHPARCHLEVGDQTLGAVAEVFVLLALDQPRELR